MPHASAQWAVRLVALLFGIEREREPLVCQLPTPRRPQPLPSLKRYQRVRNFLYGSLVAGGLLLGLELLLTMLGIGGLDSVEVVGGGYDPSAQYLIPDPGHSGGWLTAYYTNYPTIPPRGDRERLIVIGGSSAGRFSALSFETAFTGAVGPARFEVVNLGCNGFGSARARLIFDQALERLDPSVLLVYTGDNEFVELRPDERNAAAAPPDPAGKVARIARRSRILNTLLLLISGERSIQDAGRPEEFVKSPRTTRSNITFDMALGRYEDLRENLRSLCESARETETRLVLCTVVYNRLAAPNDARMPREASKEAVKAFGRLRRNALNDLPQFLAPLLDQGLVSARDWRAGKPRKEPPSIVLPGRRACFGPLATQEPYPQEYYEKSADIRALYDCLERFHSRQFSQEERAGLERAEQALVAALELVPRHSGALFEQGLVTYLLARDMAEVLQYFEDAASSIVVPQKGSQRINHVIREVAAEYPEVLLFDTDAFMTGMMPDGLVGWEWMLDHCHMSSGAYVVLRSEIARAILQRWPK